MKSKEKFMIEISYSFNGEKLEHEGYYDSPDEAKKAIDFLYNTFKKYYELKLCTQTTENMTPRCIYFKEGYCTGKVCER